MVIHITTEDLYSFSKPMESFEQNDPMDVDERHN